MKGPNPVRRSVLDVRAAAEARQWTTEIEAWPVGSHRWGQYAEVVSGHPVVCRTENPTACHEGLGSLVRGPLRELACSAAGAEMVDFKDKVNYKQPGGAGFRPHQDLLAYPGAGAVISVLLAVDECTEASGCLWVADGVHRLLPTDDRGVVAEETAGTLEWEPVELAAGDAVLIDGLAPHFSTANRSDRARRVLVASYSPETEGYSREHYYEARGRSIEERTSNDRRYRISTLADFEGRSPEDQPPPGDHCWHR